VLGHRSVGLGLDLYELSEQTGALPPNAGDRCLGGIEGKRTSKVLGNWRLCVHLESPFLGYSEAIHGRLQDG
jgi:hypothetical protein